MNTRYRLVHRGIRGGMYYCFDKVTGKRASINTTNEDAARQIIEARVRPCASPPSTCKSLSLLAARPLRHGQTDMAGLSWTQWPRSKPAQPNADG